ncbi:MAG: transcriptional regulator [Bacteroidales bacterium]|nr:transcriptional regulator [Bacteroidales bacterium]
METKLITKAKELRRVAERLAYFQDDGEYSYIDKYKEVLSWIYRACRELIRFHGENDEEEAEICLSVLIGYSTTVRNAKNIRRAIDRAYMVLPHLVPSLLKCQLLVYCYVEVRNQKLLDQAKQIMRTWNDSQLSEEEIRMKELLQNMEFYFY